MSWNLELYVLVFPSIVSQHVRSIESTGPILSIPCLERAVSCPNAVGSRRERNTVDSVEGTVSFDAEQ